MTETIGQRLRQARLGRGYTLEQVEQATRIRAYYLKALEEDDFLALPSVVQGRGFLRSYASHLGLDARGLLADWDANPEEAYAPPVEPLPLPYETPPADPVLEETPAPPPPAAPPTIPPLPPTATYQSEAPRAGKAAADSLTVFAEIGRKLSQQRSLLSLSLADVERYTRLRLHYLEALEAGRIDDLPSPVQGRGMLSNYARFLNLDSETLLLRFADGLQLRRMERIGVQPRRSPATRVSNNQLVIRRFISFDLVISSILIIALLGFIIWGALQVLSIQKQAAVQPSVPPVAEVLLETGTPSATPTGGDTQAAGGTAQPTGLAGIVGALNFTPLPSGNDPIQIYVIAHETAWMQVTSDDKIVFQGRIQAGSAFPFTGTRKVEVLTGNAAALQVFFNQTDLGSLGSQAQVVDLVFDDQGLIVPTVTVTPTITKTSPVTRTPTATPTPGSSTTYGPNAGTLPLPSPSPTGQ